MKHKNILIMIDNQNGFTTIPGTKKSSKKIVELSNKKIFDYKIATQYFNNVESKTNLFTRLQNWHFLKDQKEIDYVDNLKYDISLRKDVYSAINDEMLQTLYEANDNNLVQYVFICGMDTECCVLKSSVDLFEKGIIPIMLENYTFSNSGKQAHERGIKLFERLISQKAIIRGEITTKKQINDIVKSFKPNLLK